MEGKVLKCSGHIESEANPKKSEVHYHNTCLIICSWLNQIIKNNPSNDTARIQDGDEGDDYNDPDVQEFLLINNTLLNHVFSRWQ